MPKFNAVARPTGTKRDQPIVEVTILAADRDEVARKLRAILAGRAEYIITKIEEVKE